MEQALTFNAIPLPSIPIKTAFAFAPLKWPALWVLR